MRHRAVVMETGRAQPESCVPLDWVLFESSCVCETDTEQTGRLMVGVRAVTDVA